MLKTLTITGYTQECECEHCGRKLVHGIKLSDGRVVGATCLDKKLTQPKVKADGRKYRLGSEYIVKLAKVAERIDPSKWTQYGANQQAMTFVSAT